MIRKLQGRHFLKCTLYPFVILNKQDLIYNTSKDRTMSAWGVHIIGKGIAMRNVYTILAVDDQPDILRHIELSLDMSGYHIVTARDGVTALNLLRTQPVDLILADVAMPHMNGYQLYEAVRANPQWTLIPFIFMSARALDSDVRYGKALGADDYLTKPFKIEDLLAIVEGRLRRAQELAQVIDHGVATPTAEASGDLVVGALRISPTQHRVWRAEKSVYLSPREFAFLEYLARRPGQVVSLPELCKVTHGLETTQAEAGKLLYALARSLRRRLGYTAGEMGCITSVRGVGYRLDPKQ